MKSALLMLLGLIGVAACQQTPVRGDVQRILRTNLPHYEIKAVNLLEAAGQIASDFNLPVGVEWQGDPAAEKTISREWSNTTVERILFDVASFNVEYQVQISNGVVHLQRTDLIDNARNPLNIRVPSFRTTAEYSRRAAFKLRDEVSVIMRPRPLEAPSACAGSYGVSADETLVTLSMTDASVRDILDALLLNSRSAMWLVVFRNEQPETGFLRTKSIFGSTTELEEPNWAILARYHDPTTGAYRGDWKIGLVR